MAATAAIVESNSTVTMARGPVPCRTATVAWSGRSTGLSSMCAVRPSPSKILQERRCPPQGSNPRCPSSPALWRLYQKGVGRPARRRRALPVAAGKRFYDGQHSGAEPPRRRAVDRRGARQAAVLPAAAGRRLRAARCALVRQAGAGRARAEAPPHKPKGRRRNQQRSRWRQPLRLSVSCAFGQDLTCEREMLRAAHRHGIPLGMLYAVGLTETGRGDSLRPYALNIEGRAVYQSDRRTASARQS